jgi:putative tricarboxylic transport membrane protein
MIFDIFEQIFSVYGLLLIIIAVSIGILGGALPGVSTTMTVALVASLTFGMEPLWGIIFLAACQVGSTYGGSISATVLNIPGTPASAATALEGYPLARKGEAEMALSINAIASFFGNTVGVLLLLITVPLIVTIAMMFGSWEMFWFAVFGVVICANLSRVNFVKGLIAAAFGLFLSTIGMDPMWGTPRLNFDITYLLGGIPLIPAMIGLFGLSEVFECMLNQDFTAIKLKKSKYFYWGLWYSHKWLSLKAAVLGFFIGVVPGVGANIASWVGYDHARTVSKQKELFGTGIVDGLVGSETANNACVPGAYAPLLTLGVPGDAVTAIVLGVLMVHGIRPGPTFMAANPEWLYQLAIGLFLAGVAFLLLGTFIGRGIIRLLVAPTPAIMAAVVLLCVIGAYGVNIRIQDVYLMFFFGILGLLMKNNGFPVAPLILGIVLGGGFADSNFRRAMIAGHDSLLPFFTRPVSLVLVIVITFILVKEFAVPPIKTYIQRRRAVTKSM